MKARNALLNALSPPPTSPRERNNRTLLPEMPNLGSDQTPPLSTADPNTHNRAPCLPPDEAPLSLIYKYFNVKQVSLEEGVPPPVKFDLPIIHDAISNPNALLPTHVLAVFDGTSDLAVNPKGTAILIPINADIWSHRLTWNIGPVEPSYSAMGPNPQGGANRPPNRAHTRILSLPVQPLNVPHAHSLPLLLVSALGILHPNRIATYLLPSAVIGEFPANTAVLSQALAYLGPGAQSSIARPARARNALDQADARLAKLARLNHGMWKNVLALGVKDRVLSDLVEMAWAVASEAQRLRIEQTNSRP